MAFGIDGKDNISFAFSWRPFLSRSAIFSRRLEESLDRMIDVIIFVLAASGLVSLALWVLVNWEMISVDFHQLFLFWQYRHPLVLWFLVSVFFDLFLVYRVSRQQEARQAFNYRYIWKAAAQGRVADLAFPKILSRRAMLAMEDAYSLAARLRQDNISPIHLFRALLKNKQIQLLLVRLDIKGGALIEKLDRHLIVNDPKVYSGRTVLLPETAKALESTVFSAVSRQASSLDCFDLVLACIASQDVLEEILYDLEISDEKLQNAIEWFRVNDRMRESFRQYSRASLLKPSSGMNRAYTAIATPTLDHFSRDLTLAAKYGRLDFCVGRQEELSSILEAFSSGHYGVLLVGQPGVGKRTIVSGVARLMVEERVPDQLKDRRLVEIDVPSIVGGANASQAQERLLACIGEASRSGNIILYISNIENMVGVSAGSQESLDLSEVLSEALQNGNVFCVATATSENYARYIENKALGQIMTTVGVDEPGKNEAIRILESQAGRLENRYGIYFVYGALEKAVDLSDRYMHDKSLPEKAIFLLEKAASLAAKDKAGRGGACSSEYVAKAVEEMTGIPAGKVSESEGQKLLQLEERLSRRMVGQKEAVKAVANSLRRARVALKDSKRPIASFLFLGPTGVGKTELAKTVSDLYFGSEDYMIRVDMSEYQYADSVKKMIGDEQGTLGYLTEAVRKKPFALVLLDEIEKAHPDILNLFLQILDDGRLTDGQGRTISFSESIIIATSNIGAVMIQDRIKAKTSVEEIKRELVDEQLNKFMRPELINRFDGIIVFTPLSQDEVFQIGVLMLKKIKKNLEQKGIGFKADKQGTAVLARAGYDPKFGARPLRRLLQERVEDIIAAKMLAGEIRRRDTVLIDNRGEIQVEKGRQL